ncbi:hypothetical protein D3C80_2045750 [compost metagenome]
MRHPQRCKHDRNHQTGGTEKRCEAPHLKQAIFERKPGDRGKHGDDQQAFRFHAHQQNALHRKPVLPITGTIGAASRKSNDGKRTIFLPILYRPAAFR